MIRHKFLSTKDFVTSCIDRANDKTSQIIKESKEQKEANAVYERQENHYALTVAKNKTNIAYQKFSESVKTTLLFECINSIYSGVNKFKLADDSTKAISDNLINKFIEENGTDNLLRTFKSKSVLLSEYSMLINKHHKHIMEAVDKDNEDSYTIDTTLKDNFFDDLNMTNPDDAITTIRTRVSDAVQEFIDSNVSDKMDIKDIIQNVQDKVNSVKMNDQLKESYNLNAKRTISHLRGKPKNIFGAMVSNMCESVLKLQKTDDNIKSYFMNENNKLDIDKIVENCELMYTLLETVNTTKMINVDESYIKSMLDNLKA